MICSRLVWIILALIGLVGVGSTYYTHYALADTNNMPESGGIAGGGSGYGSAATGTEIPPPGRSMLAPVVVEEEQATLLVVTTMVLLGAMLFGSITILICGAVTFGVINDYENKITTGTSISTNCTTRTSAIGSPCTWLHTTPLTGRPGPHK
jgi:hypothetical protein